MNIIDLVLYLRNNAPSFEKRVGGATEFNESAMPHASLAVPYCFCVPVVRTGGDINRAHGSQDRGTSMAFIVCVTNATHGKSGSAKAGAQTADTVSRLESEIEDALLSFKPKDITFDVPPKFLRTVFLGSDLERSWHQFEFDFSWKKFDPRFMNNPVVADICQFEDANPNYRASSIKEIFIHHGEDIGEFPTVNDSYFPLPPAPVVEATDEELTGAKNNATAIREVTGAETAEEVRFVK